MWGWGTTRIDFRDFPAIFSSRYFVKWYHFVTWSSSYNVAFWCASLKINSTVFALSLPCFSVANTLRSSTTCLTPGVVTPFRWHFHFRCFFFPARLPSNGLAFGSQTVNTSSAETQIADFLGREMFFFHEFPTCSAY